jgi:hypothetical protein
VDGRHKAGHDDGGVVGKMASEDRSSIVSFRTSNPLIVMAGLVPAIHVLLSWAFALAIFCISGSTSFGARRFAAGTSPARTVESIRSSD